MPEVIQEGVNGHIFGWENEKLLIGDVREAAHWIAEFKKTDWDPQTIHKTVKHLTWRNNIKAVYDVYRDTYSRTSKYDWLVSPLSDVSQKIVNDSNAKTVSHLYPLWATNFAKNINAVATHGGIFNFYKRLANVPALILAAGPSLSDNIKHVKRLQDECVILACDATLPVLKKNGIKPHFIINLDPNLRQARLLKEYDIEDSILICNTMATPALHEYHRGRKLFYNSHGTDEFFADMAKHTGAIGAIPTAYLTTATCMFFAAGMRCNPIYFIGNDLAFYWDGKNKYGKKVASGVYILMLEVNDKRDIKKIAVIR